MQSYLAGVALRSSRVTLGERQGKKTREARASPQPGKKQSSQEPGKDSLHSARVKGSEISKLIFDSPLLTGAELT